MNESESKVKSRLKTFGALFAGIFILIILMGIYVNFIKNMNEIVFKTNKTGELCLIEVNYALGVWLQKERIPISCDKFDIENNHDGNNTIKIPFSKIKLVEISESYEESTIEILTKGLFLPDKQYIYKLNMESFSNVTHEIRRAGDKTLAMDHTIYCSFEPMSLLYKKKYSIKVTAHN